MYPQKDFLFNFTKTHYYYTMDDAVLPIRDKRLRPFLPLAINLTCISQIPFDSQAREFDIDERMPFWDSMRPWFAERGYTLYHNCYSFRDEISKYPVVTYPPFPFEGEVHYPYSYHGGDGLDLPVPPLSARAMVRVPALPCIFRTNSH